MAFAELTPINGGWTSWSSWSECSQQCHIYGQGSGYAIKSRHRTCSNPIPTFEGAACKGNSGEDAFCLNSCSCKCYNYSIYHVLDAPPTSNIFSKQINLWGTILLWYSHFTMFSYSHDSSHDANFMKLYDKVLSASSKLTKGSHSLLAHL